MTPPDRSQSDALPVAECRLDLTGLRDQRERYRALARHVADIDHRPGALAIRFGPGLDTRLLGQTLAVERECCPFFRLDYDADSRLLSATVEAEEQEPALRAIAYALTA